VHTRRWARRLAEAGQEAHLFTERPEPVEGVAVHDILGRRLPGRVGVRKLWRRWHLRHALRDLDPDVVQTHFLWPYGEWGWRTGRHPIVQGAWGSDVLIIPQRSPEKLRLAQQMLAEADAVTANSDWLADAVVALGAPPERVHRIGWGVDTRRFSGTTDRSLIDTIFPGRRVVVSPRLHKPLYNLDVLVEAVPLVLRDVPDAAFLFMGDGADTELLRAQAERLGVAGAVHFRNFAENELPLVFAGSELSVSIPSSDTGRPTSLLEAMASRLPVVVADLPAIRELVEEGEGAEVVPLRDAAATAAAITRLLADEALRERYGERNRGVVAEQADAQDETRRCVELYRRLSRS
jgi:glycosyltransferase involved in cell wall biosynthesis